MQKRLYTKIFLKLHLGWAKTSIFPLVVYLLYLIKKHNSSEASLGRRLPAPPSPAAHVGSSVLVAVGLGCTSLPLQPWCRALPFPVVAALPACPLSGSPCRCPGVTVLFTGPLAWGALCCHLPLRVPSSSLVVSSLRTSSFQSLNDSCWNHIEYVNTLGGEPAFLQSIHLCSLLIGLFYLFYRWVCLFDYVCVSVWVCHRVHVSLRGNPSFMSPCGFGELNSGW